MQYPIVVRPESANRYVALPLGMPGLKAIAATEAEAIAQASQALEKWLASAKVVFVDVPVADASNPWLDAFGRSAHDPDFAEFSDLERLRDIDNPASSNEEMLRGRLAVLAHRTAGEARIRAYAKFMETVEFFSRIPILPFDLRCEQILLGRGVEAPMPVILLGALGGMVSGGIIGMFIGAVLLTVGYQIFMEWVSNSEEGIGDEPERTSAPSKRECDPVSSRPRRISIFRSCRTTRL